MNLAIRTADLPSDAPRWTDPSGSVWVEIGDDHLVLVEHAGQPVPVADAIPRATVTRQHGELTAMGVSVVQPEAAETVIARLHKSNVEHAIRANRAEESVRHLIDDRNSNRMEADRIAAEMYRVRDALGVGPGGADLGLQVRNALAEVKQLRTRDAAWKKHVAHLESRLFDIWVLTERPARKCNGLDHDDVSAVAELADSPPLPAALRETAPDPEVDQPTTAPDAPATD